VAEIDQKQYSSDLPTVNGKLTITKEQLKEHLNIGNDKAEKILNEVAILGAFKIGSTWVIPVEGFQKFMRSGHDLPNHLLILKMYGPRKAKLAKESLQKFFEIMGEDINKVDFEGIIKKYEGILDKYV
jgi:hypothetical protein